VTNARTKHITSSLNKEVNITDQCFLEQAYFKIIKESSLDPATIPVLDGKKEVYLKLIDGRTVRSFFRSDNRDWEIILRNLGTHKISNGSTAKDIAVSRFEKSYKEYLDKKYNTTYFHTAFSIEE
jgi:hypothetical protein